MKDLLFLIKKVCATNIGEIAATVSSKEVEEFLVRFEQKYEERVFHSNSSSFFSSSYLILVIL